MNHIVVHIDRPAKEVIARASSFSSATLHEAAGKKGALPSGIKPIEANMKICGPAVTVHSPPWDNLMLHEAILAAQPGDILVIDVSSEYEAGYWGDIMTKAAQARGIQGLVIDGCVRDGREIIGMKFPVFSRGLCIQGTGKAGGGLINHPIRMGETMILPGDLIVGDSDGMVVLPKGEVTEIVSKAQKREEDEKEITRQIAEGKSTMEIYGWRSSFHTQG
ncbi:4-carboxy-4-hydroxy-2-oxoadipate aldolase/oxaloacetate decarboxylase [Bacillus thermotolerans]|uniref:4-carboxy-4-hydroxy-2-oxoadipate aldolase/oxaloacetate decarboxylase n=1 Tax=Bacillus thermotolerans TaxID=1221996 RepID=UPI0005804D8F|nr:4-carboxy-4-hydroxy-2-oxoadipate aldolase/oxaloacetate decarboxylase [Bacillus thermotolerans]KKB35188.1 Demethylmenaquinone methyltransferase [Bacillus thermotolerans]